jgi:hypothetical protein
LNIPKGDAAITINWGEGTSGAELSRADKTTVLGGASYGGTISVVR